jgi:hypothetical protein
MKQDQPSIESPARNSRAVRAGVVIVLVMLVAYAIVFVRVSRLEIFSDNIEWFRAVVTTLARRGE